jgi:hypothetical protein
MIRLNVLHSTLIRGDQHYGVSDGNGKPDFRSSNPTSGLLSFCPVISTCQLVALDKASWIGQPNFGAC